ncbi:hypothetical protein EIP75_22160 [Aquabacterium soli]|uniref:Asl1-like glycosyl hydrolase catalytic domain-containing protein n=1 Tax=Aquabacterium soli TaxID=2493092 RepID=A0A3R8RZU5_9BURK|nr:hypothetical protein [Aquabacterium soli]RRS01034.1 hypothetical protein EIP75_22160 [Aquabacterium soli]
MRMKAWLWIGACVAVLSATTLVMLKRSSAHWMDADMVHAVASVSDPSQPPSGYFHQLMDDNRVEGPLTVTYRTEPGQDGQLVLVIAVDSQSRRTTNYNLFLASKATTVTPGERYVLGARMSASDNIREPVLLGLGFQLYKPNDAYLGDTSPASGMFKAVLGDGQPVSAVWASGQVYEQGDQTAASLRPRLSLHNIPPGFKGEIRLAAVNWSNSGATAQAAAKAQPASVAAATAPTDRTWTATAGQLLPLSVPWPEASGPANGTLVLQSPSGQSQSYPAERPVLIRDDDGQLQSWWQLRIPKDWAQGASAVMLSVGSEPARQVGSLKVVAQAGVFIGHAFHRYPGPSEKAFGPLTVRYQFARSLSNDLTYLNQWWTGDGTYDWRGIDRWADFHAGPGQRRLLLTFSGSPRWASQSPHQPSAMGQNGNAAPPQRALFPAYQRMVQDTVARYKGRVLAVECWNEPNSPDFFSGTQADLADLCQLVHDGTKAVAPEVPVICPQADSPEKAAFVYGARTSKGESILARCDAVGAHIYNRLGRDTQGRGYAAEQLDDSLKLLHKINQRYGVQGKPIAVTEFGASSCVTRPTRYHPLSFGKMPSSEAGDALYQSLSTFREHGVWMVALYSFDHEDNNPECRPGGSFTRMTRVDEKGRQVVDQAVVNRLNEAVSDFGRPEGVSTR